MKHAYSYMRYLELIKDQLPVRPVSLVVVGNFMKIFDASLLISSVEAEEAEASKQAVRDRRV